MSLEFSAAVRRIPIYPAASAYALPEDVALLASNESPEPPIAPVLEAITRVIGGLNRYPDPSSSILRKALSDRYGVPASRIMTGNGSCDILLAMGTALLEEGAELVYAWPSFSIYPHLTAMSGATEVAVPLDARDEHDLDAMLAEITVATRMVIVCNPNNPTSTALPLARIAAFVEQVPRNVLVVLDEAYCEYMTIEDPDASIDLLSKHPNLVLLRTFSKAYGLCGLRVGYALCGSDEIVSATNRVRQPFFCNAVAQAAATEALKHQDAVTGRVERALVAKLDLEEGLAALGISAADSQANFAWLDLPAPATVTDTEELSAFEEGIVRDLASRGVLVRSGTALGKPGALRVTYGTPAQNARFLRELGDLLQS
jgi:histidinol-phosphate aminotransferase